MTLDGGFRLVATALGDTVSGAAEAQCVGAPLSVRLAELMTGAVLLRETTSPSRRVQISLRDSAGGSLIADSLPDGTTRGLVNPGAENPDRLRGDTIMRVTHTLMQGRIHHGVVSVPEGSAISEALMTYLQESEQILTNMVVAATAEGGALTAAGYVVQLLPELERTPLAAMTERLDELEPLADVVSRGAVTAGALVDRILYGFEHSILADSPIRFGCNCSRDRIINGIATLAPDEISAMIAAAEPLAVRCDACGQSYEIQPAELAAP